MTTITLRRLDLQFDANQITGGKVDEQVMQAVERINEVLQREPFGLGARLITHSDEIEVEKHE